MDIQLELFCALSWGRFRRLLYPSLGRGVPLMSRSTSVTRMHGIRPTLFLTRTGNRHIVYNTIAIGCKVQGLTARNVGKNGFNSKFRPKNNIMVPYWQGHIPRGIPPPGSYVYTELHASRKDSTAWQRSALKTEIFWLNANDRKSSFQMTGSSVEYM